MQGVGIIEFGGPEVLTVVDLPEVQAGPGQVRLRVHAATVNPTDTIHRSGARAEVLARDPPPYIPGMDVAGVIDQIGPGTDTSLALGDRVMAMVIPSGSHGAYRQQLVLAADAVAPAPAGTTHAEASTLPMNGLTALRTFDQLDLVPGDSLAVTGAAGCYGGYLVQIAKAAGLFVIADATEADHAIVMALGADVVVERGPDVAERILTAVPGGVDALADGSVQREQLTRAVRDGGTFASVRGWEGTGERDLRFVQTWVREYDNRGDLLDQLRQQVDDGALTLRVAATFPMEDAAEAHRRLEAGGSRGRLVIEL
jgi:NADPH:quinone reductase